MRFSDSFSSDINKLRMTMTWFCRFTSGLGCGAAVDLAGVDAVKGDIS